MIQVGDVYIGKYTGREYRVVDAFLDSMKRTTITFELPNGLRASFGEWELEKYLVKYVRIDGEC